MDHALTSTRSIDLAPGGFLESVGVIFRTFGPDTQDSGNMSYGIEIAGQRFFVKTTDPGATAFLNFAERVELLRNAVRVRRSCDHGVLPRLHNVVESPCGPLLVYDWVDGELLHDEAARQRFRRLQAAESLAALDQVVQLHQVLADADWVAGDFYDGCLIYDFDNRTLHVVDLDHYHRGAYTNTIGRMFGSSRFMAPEEFQQGQTIDQRTTVFNLGRAIAVLLSDGTLDKTAFRGDAMLHDVMIRACRPEPDQRHESVRAFSADWQRARHLGGPVG